MTENCENNKIVKEKRNRIWELDFLRGFAIIMVVFDHIFTDVTLFYSVWISSGNPALVNFAEYALSYYLGDLRLTWRPVFLCMFFLISGMCSSFSRNNFLRFLKLFLVSVLLINLGTYLVGLISGDVDSIFIKFGVLHCFSLCILFTAIIQFIIDFSTHKGKKIKKYRSFIFGVAMLVVSIIAFVLQNIYNIGYPEFLYLENFINTDNPVLGMFIYTVDWNSNDYFPLLPWFAFFALGAALAPFIYYKKQSLLKALDHAWHKPITFAGRYSLFIYLISTVLCTLIYALISYFTLGTWVIF